jgi:hypothetical protein
VGPRESPYSRAHPPWHSLVAARSPRPSRRAPSDPRVVYQRAQRGTTAAVDQVARSAAQPGTGSSRPYDLLRAAPGRKLSGEPFARVRIPEAVVAKCPRNRAFPPLSGQGANRSGNPIGWVVFATARPLSRITSRVVSPTSTDLVAEWERRAGEKFKAHFRQAWSYFGQTVRELASDQAAWTITDHADHAVLLLASDTAFALIAFSGPPDGVTIKGALHPLDERKIRVSFNDQLADEVVMEGVERFRPMSREWSFDWHGRLQLPIRYWLPRPLPATTKQVLGMTLSHHQRQRAMAHKLASAAGWPLPTEFVESDSNGEAG